QKALSAEQPSLNFPLVEDEHARNEQNADVKQPVSDNGEPIERSVLDLGSGIDDRILDVIVREVRHDANHKLSDRLHKRRGLRVLRKAAVKRIEHGSNTPHADG